MLRKDIPDLIGVHFYREFRFNFARVSMELFKERIVEDIIKEAITKN